ncbi:hypothetical protein [Pusillimonas sp. ANT_WB101]|uniref:hypothetical protein n=1 Tax=Pusillimonas sp. ANT_WB101 TaxID=2597356 RepID=UPI00165DEF06|nr:hypothetical protein [Pusillimonas sp. ANT_WB101]
MPLLSPPIESWRIRTELDRLLVRVDQVLPGLRFPLPTPSGLGLTTELGDPGLCAMCDFWACIPRGWPALPGDALLGLSHMATCVSMRVNSALG